MIYRLLVIQRSYIINNYTEYNTRNMHGHCTDVPRTLHGLLYLCTDAARTWPNVHGCCTDLHGCARTHGRCTDAARTFHGARLTVYAHCSQVKSGVNSLRYVRYIEWALWIKSEGTESIIPSKRTVSIAEWKSPLATAFVSNTVSVSTCSIVASNKRFRCEVLAFDFYSLLISVKWWPDWWYFRYQE